MKIEGLHEKEIFNEQFPVRLIVNQDIDFDYPAHWHNAIELLYVIKNSFVVFVNSQRYDMRENDILFIPSGDIHEFKSEMNTGTRVFINFELSSFSIYSFLERIRSHMRDVRLIVPEDGSLHKEIEAEIQKMMNVNDLSDFTNQLYYTARIVDIVLLLCKSTTSHINIENMVSSKKKLNGLEKINRSFEYIEKNYCEDICLKDIANAAGFSEFYFSRLFKEITEKSFHQFLIEFRIKKAEILLTDSNYSISEAAYSSGFSSISTFDRLFKKIKGCSPQEFRKLKVN
jgi:AraC-like DNA-binding protein